MPRVLEALWLQRDFIFGSVKREFRSRYASSLLGAGWAVLNPFAMILVYTVVLSNVMQARLPGVDSAFSYSVYLCAGVLPWGLFSEVVGRCVNVFLEQANLIKKLNFPRICLPAIVILHAVINFGIAFALFLAFLLVTGLFPGWVVLAAIPLVLILTLLAAGLGVALGVLNVFFRDVGQVTGIVMQFWFWLTPIVYSSNIVGGDLEHALLYWNPLGPLAAGMQGVFVNRSLPHWEGLIWPAALAGVLCIAAFVLFRRHAAEMVDEL